MKTAPIISLCLATIVLGFFFIGGGYPSYPTYTYSYPMYASAGWSYSNAGYYPAYSSYYYPSYYSSSYYRPYSTYGGYGGTFLRFG